MNMSTSILDDMMLSTQILNQISDKKHFYALGYVVGKLCLRLSILTRYQSPHGRNKLVTRRRQGAIDSTTTAPQTIAGAVPSTML